MPRALQMRQHHDDEQRPDMKTRRGGIESDVAGHFFARQRLARALSGAVDQPAPLELAIHIHRMTTIPASVFLSFTEDRRLEIGDRRLSCFSLAVPLSRERSRQRSVA